MNLGYSSSIQVSILDIMISYYKTIITSLGIGGTIGMLVGQQGYVPEPFFLTETLRSQTRFHDPFQDSLFSNAGSVQGFREWSSGRASPQQSPNGNTTPVPDSSLAGKTLVVRSSCPIGHSSTLGTNIDKSASTQPKCIRVSENVYEAHLPALLTPPSKVPGGSRSKSIRYAILEVIPGFISLVPFSIFCKVGSTPGQ